MTNPTYKDLNALVGDLLTVASDVSGHEMDDSVADYFRRAIGEWSRAAAADPYAAAERALEALPGWRDHLTGCAWAPGKDDAVCSCSGREPVPTSASVRCCFCKHDVPEDTTRCMAGVGTQCKDSAACRARRLGPSDAPPEKTWEQAVADGSVAKSLAEDGRIARFRQWAGETLKDWFDNAEARQIVAYVDASRTDYPTAAFEKAMLARIRWMQEQDARSHGVGRFTSAIEELSVVLRAFYRNSPSDIEICCRDYTGLTSVALHLDEYPAEQKRGAE